MESEFYLNNAGVSGTGTTDDVTPSGGSGGVTPGEPSYNTTATINGVNQNIAGGSVTATAPITRVAVSGSNLGDVTFTAKVDGTGDAINPTSHDANGATFNGPERDGWPALGGLSWRYGVVHHCRSGF